MSVQEDRSGELSEEVESLFRETREKLTKKIMDHIDLKKSHDFSTKKGVPVLLDKDAKYAIVRKKNLEKLMRALNTPNLMKKFSLTKKEVAALRKLAREPGRWTIKLNEEAGLDPTLLPYRDIEISVYRSSLKPLIAVPLTDDLYLVTVTLKRIPSEIKPSLPSLIVERNIDPRVLVSLLRKFEIFEDEGHPIPVGDIYMSKTQKDMLEKLEWYLEDWIEAYRVASKVSEDGRRILSSILEKSNFWVGGKTLPIIIESEDYAYFGVSTIPPDEMKRIMTERGRFKVKVGGPEIITGEERESIPPPLSEFVSTASVLAIEDEEGKRAVYLYFPIQRLGLMVSDYESFINFIAKFATKP